MAQAPIEWWITLRSSDTSSKTSRESTTADHGVQVKTTQYTPEEEQELMTTLWSPAIADDPLAFVMFVYPWGVKGTPLEHFAGPRKWQRRVLKKIRNHIAAGKELNLAKLLRLARSSGRGIGKSALVSWLIDWFNSTRIGSTVIVSANTEDQLRKVTWAELAKWTAMSIHQHWWEIVGIVRNPAKWLRELVSSQLQKGTEYWGATGKLWSEENPDAYAGVHNHDGVMVIFDEASGIPDGIWAVAQGFFTEITQNRFWLAFSQGRRNSGYFFEIFNKKRDMWDGEQIDARTVEGTDNSIYADIIEEYGEDSDEARVEVYGLFPDNDDIAFISYTLAEKASVRVNDDDLTAPVTMGVDPSRSGSDWFVIVTRQGRKVIDIKRFKIGDSEIGTMEGVGHIINALEEFDPDICAIDEGGLGGPIHDRLKEQGYGRLVKGVNFAWKASKPTRWGNKRAEIWGEMKKWLQVGQIPDDKRLKTDLTGVRKKPDSKGVMLLESKKDMKGRGLASPDSGDALALTFAFKVKKREYNGSQSKRPVQHLPTGYTSTGWMGS